jgi:hypothetical protein
MLDATSDQRLRKIFPPNSVILDSALRLLLDEPSSSAVICYPGDTVAWGSAAETCRLDESKGLTSVRNGTERAWPAESLVVFQFNENGQVVLQQILPGFSGYAPEKLILSNRPPSRRACQMLVLPKCS